MTGLWFGAGVGLLLAAAGWITYVFAPRVGPNPIFGVRTGYSMVSREVWDRSNRAGGLLLAAIGAAVAMAGAAVSLWGPGDPEAQILWVAGIMMALLIKGVVGLVLYTRHLARGVAITSARPLRLSVWLLLPAALVTTAVVLFVLATASELPASRVATHFALDGTPNDWMNSSSYILMMVSISLGMFGVLAGLFFGTTHAAIPGADQWAVSGEAVIEAVAGMFTWVQVLIAVVALDTYWFNTREQHILPMGLMVAMSVGITTLSVLAMIVYVALRGWRRPAQDTSGGEGKPV